MPATGKQLAKYISNGKKAGKGSKAKGRKPKFDASKFSQEALGTPF